MSLAMQPTVVPCLIREATDAETPLILQTWVRSYDRLMPAREKTWGKSRADWIHHVASACLARDGASVVEYEGVPDAVLGWVCGRSDAKNKTVHYVYVKKDARQMGLATQLLEALFGRHPSEVHGARMTHRPHPKQRFKVNAIGWYWKPLSPEEL